MVHLNAKAMRFSPLALYSWDKFHQAEFDNKEKWLLYVDITRITQLICILGSRKKLEWVKT